MLVLGVEFDHCTGDLDPLVITCNETCVTDADSTTPLGEIVFLRSRAGNNLPSPIFSKSYLLQRLYASQDSVIVMVNAFRVLKTHTRTLSLVRLFPFKFPNSSGRRLSAL